MKYALTVVIMSVTAVIHIWMIRFHADAANNIVPPAVALPDSIGSYRQQGGDIGPTDRVREILQTSAVLTRNYAAPNGQPVQLTIVTAMNSRTSLHFPEVCLVGAGFEISEQLVTRVGFHHTARRLVIIKGDQREAVLYWFKTGDRLTGNFFLNTGYWVWDTILFKGSSTSMIKLTAPISGDKERVFRMLEDFAAALSPLLLDSK